MQVNLATLALVALFLQVRTPLSMCIGNVASKHGNWRDTANGRKIEIGDPIFVNTLLVRDGPVRSGSNIAIRSLYRNDVKPALFDCEADPGICNGPLDLKRKLPFAPPPRLSFLSGFFAAIQDLSSKGSLGPFARAQIDAIGKKGGSVTETEQIMAIDQRVFDLALLGERRDETLAYKLCPIAEDGVIRCNDVPVKAVFGASGKLAIPANPGLYEVARCSPKLDDYICEGMTIVLLLESGADEVREQYQQILNETSAWSDPVSLALRRSWLLTKAPRAGRGR